MAKRKNARELAIRVTMTPADTNGRGHIFGGVLLSHIDLAGANATKKACPGALITKAVTRAMSQVRFKKPVFVNDVLTCYTKVTGFGRTSVTVHVDAEVERDGKMHKVTQADMVFVALDEQDKPMAIACAPPQKPQPPRPKKEPVVLDPAKRMLAVRKTMLPKDTNDMGNIFGGVLLSYMDIAGSYAAQRVCGNKCIHRCVTLLMDDVEFKQAVKVGDVISCYGTVTKVGTTSIHVHVEVEAERLGQIIPVTCCEMVFVAVDEGGKPTTVACAKRTPSGKSTGCKGRCSRRSNPK